MAKTKDKFYQVPGTVTASATADDATVTVSYPSGTSQKMFTAGLTDRSGTYAIFNNNDRKTYGDPGDFELTFGSSTITITNRSGASWAAGTKIDLHIKVRSKRRVIVPIPVPPLAGITAADIITDMRLGIAGYLLYAEFVTTVAVTTAAKAATLNFEIGTTDVTGLTLALASADATPKGKVLPFGEATANNRLEVESLLSLEASSVTAFSEGEGYINLHIEVDDLDLY